MTELELRKKVVDIISSWLGAPKGSETHHQIIDVYNSRTPLPRGVRMSYTMDWCAATVSAAGIAAGLADIMPPECSCGELIKKYKALGRWVEEDSYIPKPGDLIFYAWSDDGEGDCKRAPNHVGMVVEVKGDTVTVVEGNMGTGTGSRVGKRSVKVNGRYIRGYCCPDYASKAAEGEKEEPGKVYRYVSEMPQWAQGAATKAILNGYVKMDEAGAVTVWECNLQPLVWMERAGVLDKPVE